MDVLTHNRDAWNKEVLQGNKWTKPVESSVIEEAKKGILTLLLTPTKIVPKDWLPDLRNTMVLCLASGGGQQGPIFAAAGAEVTVFDNSPAQLEQDLIVAKRENVRIKTVQGDMRNLSCFDDESFDLIFHPISNCFIHDIRPVWHECYRVLKKNGCLLSGFNNPITYIFDLKEWDSTQTFLVKYKIPYSDIEQLPKKELEERIQTKSVLEFGHSLTDQIGGQISAGFIITGFYEDSTGGDLLDPYIDTTIATKAIKK